MSNMKVIIIGTIILMGAIGCAQKNTVENIAKDADFKEIDKTAFVKDEGLKKFLTHFYLLPLPLSKKGISNFLKTADEQNGIILYNEAVKYLGKTEKDKYFMWIDYNYDDDIKILTKEEMHWNGFFKYFSENYIVIIYETFKNPQNDDSSSFVIKTMDYEGHSVDEIWVQEEGRGYGSDQGGFFTKDGVNFTTFFFQVNEENQDKNFHYIDENKPKSKFSYETFKIDDNGKIIRQAKSDIIYLKEPFSYYYDNSYMFQEDLIE